MAEYHMGSELVQAEQDSNCTTTVRTMGEDGWPDVRQDGWRWVVGFQAGQRGQFFACNALPA